MRSNHQIDVVLSAELLSDIWAKHEHSSAFSVWWTVSSSSSGIWPQEINDHSTISFPFLFLSWSIVNGILVTVGCQLCIAIHCSNLCQGGGTCIHRNGIFRIVCLARQPYTRPRTWNTSMDHQDFVVDQMKQRQISERLREKVKEIQVILGTNFSCKAIDHICLQHFVIPSVHEHRGRILHLHSKDQQGYLDGPWATVHEVTVKQEWP